LGLPLYYRDPQPHVSLAWAPGDVREQLRGALDEMHSEQGSKEVGDGDYCWVTRLRRVTCLVGCRFWNVWGSGDDVTREEEAEEGSAGIP
jgi:hypothetical protein